MENLPPIRHDRPELDGLRALASLMVVYFHGGLFGWYQTVYGLGDIGVMLFFTLSGFLMAYHYMPDHFSWRYWAAFYIRRFFRIYPAFFIACFGFLIFHHHLPYPEPMWDSSDWRVLLKVWGLRRSDGVFWTIPVELKFYLVYPCFAFVALIPWIHKAYRYLLLPATWVCFIVLNGMGMLPWFARFVIFFLGGMSAAGFLRHSSLCARIRHGYWDAAGAVIFGIVLWIIVQNPWHYTLSSPRPYNQIWLFSPLLAGCILCVALASPGTKWWFSNPVATYLGRISFSLYLTHLFVQYPGNQLLPPFFHFTGFMVVLVLFCASFFYHNIEEPFHRLGKRLAQRLYVTP